MKKNRGMIVSSVVAALCLSMAQRIDAADVPLGGKTAAGDKPQTATHDDAPAQCNKASGIIGMEVRNHKAERLGVIKDVAFDLKSEKVAYAVMNAGRRGFFSQEKLLAVPLNAFIASDDNSHLILRAEKSKLETAMGFDRNDWPSITNPAWGAEPFWETTADKTGVIDQPKKERVTIPKLETHPDLDPGAQPKNEPYPKTDDQPKDEPK